MTAEVAGAPADAVASGVPVLDPRGSGETLLPDSLESAVQEIMASRQMPENAIKSRLARCVIMVLRRSRINVARADTLAHRVILIHG